MLIFQIQIKKTAICSSSNWLHVLEKDRQSIQEATKCVWGCRWDLSCRVWQWWQSCPKIRHMHEALWWKKTSILRNWYSKDRIGSRATADRKWNGLSSRGSTPQQHPKDQLLSSAIACQAWKKKQQYCKRSNGDTEWNQEIPQYCFDRGKWYHISQATSGNL